MPRQAVIFDLDGTLIDSIPGITGALNTILGELGRPALSQADVIPMVGDGGRRTVERGLDATGGRTGVDIDTVFERWMRTYTEDEAPKTAPFPGVMATLEKLADGGYPLGLCTNKTRIATLPLLETLGLARFFVAVVTPDDTPFPKPDGRHILATIAAMKMDAARSVYVGDSEIDAAAAASAGVPFILVSYGYARGPLDDIRADGVIGDFGELPATLLRLP